ncbi:MAG TPA: hypothetical protein VFH70_02040, partial [Acidimicrobiales bacterium]|nr:hypothetical protein [Acidimicrobiales bacterium]
RSDNQSFAESAVDVVKSAAYASRDFAAIKGPKSTGCVAATAKVVFDRQNQKSATKFTAGKASFIPAPAPFFGIRLGITLTLPNGTTEPAVSDTFYMQKGNDEAQYGFLTVGGPDTNAETAALASLAKRTQA